MAAGQKYKKTAFFVTLLACLLVALGDIRGLITPVGYWLTWLIVIVAGLMPAWASWRMCRDGGELLLLTVFFIMMCLGFFLSSAANSDPYTFYQGLKMLVIAAFISVLHGCARYLGPRDYLRISCLTVAVGFLCFVGAKYLATGFFVQLGDGRQGSLFAWPGVLWKTAVFFVGFFIAQLFHANRFRAGAALSILVCGYLLVSDSSRTGFLWFCFILMAFGISVLRRRVMLALTLALLIAAAALLAAVTFLANTDPAASAPLLLNRFMEGDPIRNAMLQAGLEQAERCLPFGCGFGSTTAMVDGSPMVVHNTYLSSLGDIGVPGLLAVIGLLATPLIFHVLRNLQPARDPTLPAFTLAALMGVCGYGFLLLFHPFSTEMSEWGLWGVMAAALSSLSVQSSIANIRQAEPL